ncbi:DegQ family serine endoprotease [Desulfoprunum benzoelyticum]|uniref:Probable periplasmic serine endoprotease DegP-like n=1 Tax=Desulfoprunum benzoelyticum TaxID=1506996 RepID=A0A840UUY1_9BACT|nr:DegQ family serine endoprotease [Desulfoprunum benzoelyticum]MBB5348646.1 serine protease Do [Desulfoprunum benzoelyticum]MBM9529899.1 DegQ family serine endoprotease [Desulfoprunum benzoelyticum]
MKSQTYLPSRSGLLALLFLFSFIIAASPSPARAEAADDIALLDRSSRAFVNVVKAAQPAVVNIRVEKSVERKGGFPGDGDEMFNNPFFEHFFGPQFRGPHRFQQQGQGSGFIINRDGYILTNNHVVEGADTITVRLSDEREFKAKLVGSDPQTDVAMIKIQDSGNLPTLTLGNSDALEVGEWVIAIGNPFGLNQTVTVGVVSAKGRNRVGINEYESFIQTDAAINPGNSGGPLLNTHGEVIGINSALFSRTGGYMGIGFAIPINMVKAIEDQLQKHGKVTRGWLGVAIQDVNEDLAKSFDLKQAKGILISEVQPDSPASKAEMKQGDVILRLNGAELKDVSDLRNKVALITPGTKATLTIIRSGSEKMIDVVIGEQPSGFGKTGSGLPSQGNLEQFGLNLQDLTPELAQQLGYTAEQKGVVISAVAPGSPAEKAGLQAGYLIEEVNKVGVSNLKELQLVLKKSTQPKRILLRVHSGNLSQYVVLVAQ